MIDTGATMTPVTKKWAKAHGLKTTLKSNCKVTGAAGMPGTMLGITSFTMYLSLAVEIYVAEVGVCQFFFY